MEKRAVGCELRCPAAHDLSGSANQRDFVLGDEITQGLGIAVEGGRSDRAQILVVIGPCVATRSLGLERRCQREMPEDPYEHKGPHESPKRW